MQEWRERTQNREYVELIIMLKQDITGIVNRHVECFSARERAMSTSEPTSRLFTESAALARSRRTGSSPWHRLLRRAEEQAEQGDFQQAIITLESAIAAGADAYELRLRIAELYRNLQDWNAALMAAETARALAPGRLRAYEALMTIALESGDCPRAVTACNSLIKLSPRHLLAHNALGAAYIQMGEVDAAMRVTNTLIRLDPETPAHHFKKALLCQHKGEIALAVHEFSETIRLDGDGPHAEAAREALETLDVYQLNQIITLAIEDRVFRAKLEREPLETVVGRGFALSEMGSQILLEILCQPLPEFPDPCLPLLYN